MLPCKVRYEYCLRIVISVALVLTLAGCGEDPPLKIGFVGGLTGRVADLGVAGRDGAIYAVEEKNAAGGIAGRKIDLLIRDDEQNPDVARKAVQDLIDSGVLAIVGPMTSSMGLVVKPVVDAGQVPMISPTVKTDQLSGQDDYFLRVTTPLSNNAVNIATYAVKQKSLKTFAVVYDLNNRAFTETWLKYFREALQALGGEVVAEEAFTSHPDVHFTSIAEKVIEKRPQSVLLLSNAIDTAMLAQQLRKLEFDVPLFSSEWAFTTDLISFGGRAVDGMTSFHSFDANDSSPKYLEFKNGFMKRFGYEPSFATTLAYDATTFLFHGMEKAQERKSLKNALLQTGTFSGLQSEISVDRYGDVERGLFLTVVQGGSFRVEK